MSDPLVAAALYAAIFLYLSFKWPQFALIAIFASAPFQNDVSIGGPVRFSLAEVNLALAAFVFVMRFVSSGRHISFGPIAIPLLIYLGVCVISSIGDFRGESTLVSFLQMTIYLAVDVLVFTWLAPKTAHFRIVLIAMVCVCLVLAAMSVVTGSNSIIGLNKNGLGGSLSFGVIVGVELWFSEREVRARRLLIFATGVIAMGLVISLSRGSWIGTVTGLTTAAFLRKRFKFMLWCTLALCPFIALCWHLLPDDSKDFATGFDSSRDNISRRLDSIDFAKDQFSDSPIIGKGVGLRKEFDATNIIMTVLAETGIVGLFGFAVFHFGVFRMIKTAQAGISPAEPMYSYLILGGALVLAKLAHGMVDHYWSRGDLMLTWGAVGMANRVFFISVQRASSQAATSRRKGRLQPARSVQVNDNVAGADILSAN